MKIAFIQEFWQEYQGIMYLSAFAKQNGHKTEVFIKGEKNLMENICSFQPDIVGLCITTGSHNWALNVSKQLKNKLNIPVIFGGPHPTVCPGIIEKDSVDIICRGEGEYALVELLNNLGKGKDITKIKNLWVKKDNKIYKNEIRPLIGNLNILPQPDWPLYYKYKFLKDKKTKTFTSSRGCPFNCTFCTNHTFRNLFAGKGNYVRQRSADNFLEEIKSVKKVINFDTITFDDEIFILNKEWLKEFLPRYKNEIGLPFFCGLRADLITEEIADLLKENGCYGISFGIETGNENLRNVILGKGVTNEKIIKAAEIVHKKGIILRTTNMFCLPAENIDISLETLMLNIKCKVDHPFAYLFQPLPQTKAFEYSIANGYLPKDFSFDQLEELHLNNNPLILKDKNRMLNLQKFFYLTVKHPFLLPVTKTLIKLPPNAVYDLIFKISLVLNYRTYKRLSLLTTLKLGLKMEMPNLFKKNN